MMWSLTYDSRVEKLILPLGDIAIHSNLSHLKVQSMSHSKNKKSLLAVQLTSFSQQVHFIICSTTCAKTYNKEAKVMFYRIYVGRGNLVDLKHTYISVSRVRYLIEDRDIGYATEVRTCIWHSRVKRQRIKGPKVSIYRSSPRVSDIHNICLQAGTWWTWSKWKMLQSTLVSLIVCSLLPCLTCPFLFSEKIKTSPPVHRIHIECFHTNTTAALNTRGNILTRWVKFFCKLFSVGWMVFFL